MDIAKYSNYLFKIYLLILSILKHKDMYGYELSKEVLTIHIYEKSRKNLIEYIDKL